MIPTERQLAIHADIDSGALSLKETADKYAISHLGIAKACSVVIDYTRILLPEARRYVERHTLSVAHGGGAYCTAYAGRDYYTASREAAVVKVVGLMAAERIEPGALSPQYAAQYGPAIVDHDTFPALYKVLVSGQVIKRECSAQEAHLVAASINYAIQLGVLKHGD